MKMENKLFYSILTKTVGPNTLSCGMWYGILPIQTLQFQFDSI